MVSKVETNMIAKCINKTKIESPKADPMSKKPSSISDGTSNNQKVRIRVTFGRRLRHKPTKTKHSQCSYGTLDLPAG